MSKPKRDKFTATATPDKTRQNQPLVQLTEAQLEAIVGGGLCNTAGGRLFSPITLPFDLLS